MRDTAIQFSGGKDSLAALYVSREWWPRSTVYFWQSSMHYPHMVEFVHRTCDELGLPLKIIRPPVPIDEYHKTDGIPSDLIPVEASPEMRPYNRSAGQLLQSPLRCCGLMQWLPMQIAIEADGIKHVIRGSKAADQHVGAPDGTVDARGITYHSPLWTWTDDDVFSYLKNNDIPMAAHYGEVNNSFDCILCTAFMRSDGARARLEWTKRHHPEQWPELKRRAEIVRRVIDDERGLIATAMAAIS